MLYLTFCFHHMQLTFASCNKINYFTCIFLWHIHYKRFIRLTFFTVDLFYQNLWLTNC